MTEPNLGNPFDEPAGSVLGEQVYRHPARSGSWRPGDPDAQTPKLIHRLTQTDNHMPWRAPT
jgi:hypothetical protein